MTLLIVAVGSGCLRGDAAGLWPGLNIRLLPGDRHHPGVVSRDAGAQAGRHGVRPGRCPDRAERGGCTPVARRGVIAAPRPVHESVRRRSEAPLYADAVRLPTQHASVAANTLSKSVGPCSPWVVAVCDLRWHG